MTVAWMMVLTTEERRNFRHILKKPKELMSDCMQCLEKDRYKVSGW